MTEPDDRTAPRCVCWTRPGRVVCAACLAAGCDERGQSCRRGLTRDHPPDAKKEEPEWCDCHLELQRLRVLIEEFDRKLITPYGEHEGGFVLAYIVPTGGWHRILAAAREPIAARAALSEE